MRIIKAMLIALLISPILGHGQMVFEDGDWASVKAKAKKENKIIFIDLYTTWCGPCKVMARNIFPLKEVGDFYNANFVNFKIDAEKGEGIELNKKFGVTAYPTYVFADSNGDFLHQSVGSFSADKFIAEGKLALDPSKQLKNLIADNENISKEETPAYLRYLKSQNLPLNEKYEKYIGSLTKEELLNNETFELIKEFGGKEPRGFSYELMIENKDDFAEVIGDDILNNYFFGLFLQDAYLYRGRKEPYGPVLDKVNELGFDFAQKIDDAIQLTALIYTDKDFAAYVNEAPKFLRKYSSGHPEIKYYPVYFVGSIFFLRDPKLEDYVIKLAGEVIADGIQKPDQIYTRLGYGYFQANRLDKAIEYNEKALKESDTEQSRKQILKSIKFIKERKTVLESGVFTLNGEGYGKYDGHEFTIKYPSSGKIGKFEQTVPVIIENGTFSLSGNAKTILPATWIISKKGKTVAEGKIIIEPGTYKVSSQEGLELMLENSTYNYEGLYAWMLFPPYKEITDKLENDKSLGKDEIDSLKTKRAEEKMNYITKAYARKTDNMIKLLLAYEGELYKDPQNGQINLAFLKQQFPDHVLVKTMEKKFKKWRN